MLVSGHLHGFRSDCRVLPCLYLLRVAAIGVDVFGRGIDLTPCLTNVSIAYSFGHCSTADGVPHIYLPNVAVV